MRWQIPLLIFTFCSKLLFGVNCESDCYNPCTVESPCATCTDLWPSEGPDWIITPNAGPCVVNGADIYLTGSFIYWTMRQDQMAFGVTNEQIENVEDPDPRKGKVFHPDWNYRPGFKVGLGLLFDCDGWDLYAEYTWLRNRDTREKAQESRPPRILRLSDYGWVVVPNNTFLQQQWVVSTAEWEHDFNVVDGQLGRNFYISQCLKLRPHIGLKGTWQKQKMTIDTAGLATSSSINFSEASGRYDIDYWGVGIRAGLDTAWQFSSCFSLIGKLSTSLLWEEFDSEIFVTSQDFITELSSVEAYFKDEFCTLKPVIETLIGLRLETWFCCDEYHIGLDVAWETQWWAGQNQFLTVYNETRGGDLIAQGLTTTLRFDF